jgi:hypothetical protein
MFDPGWMTAHRRDIDLVHLHFGFDSVDPSDLARWCNELSDLDIPLVMTVHDLRNPHHATRRRHDEQLDVLLASAAEVITLTPGAAQEIQERYARRAEVIPHPGVLAPGQPRPQHTAPIIGIALKARAQVVEPDAVVRAALTATERSGAELIVDADPAVLGLIPETIAADHAGRLRLRERIYLNNAAFAGYLAGIDVSILPYRFGTHSGWLEACHDVGTRVVAPDCGYYAQQWDEVVSYSNDEQWGLDPESLEVAVRTALMAPQVQPASPDWRRAQSVDSRAEHRRIYLATARSLRSAAA